MFENTHNNLAKMFNWNGNFNFVCFRGLEQSRIAHLHSRRRVGGTWVRWYVMRGFLSTKEECSKRACEHKLHLGLDSIRESWLYAFGMALQNVLGIVFQLYTTKASNFYQ